MGQTTRTTKLFLNLGKRDQGGANADKRAALTATVELLNGARAFYIDFFLAHADKLAERVSYYSQQHLEIRERAISANELLTWAEACTVETQEHPHPSSDWNFSQRFPNMPFIYRRSVIKDAIGKVRSYLSHRANWERSSRKQGQPGLPGARDHPTLYKGTCSLELASSDLHARFVRIKVYDGKGWTWVNYPVKCSRYFEQRLNSARWEHKSPILVLRADEASLHFRKPKRFGPRK